MSRLTEVNLTNGNQAVPRVASAERARMKSQGQLKSSGDTESTSHGRYVKIDYEPREGDQSRLDEFSKETGGHKHTARRKVHV